MGRVPSRKAAGCCCVWREAGLQGWGLRGQVKLESRTFGNSWESGTQTRLEQFSHWPFPTGGCLLSNSHGNPHPQYSASEGLHPLAPLLLQQRTGLH